MKLNKCSRCGSDAGYLDISSCTEMGGVSHQNVDISCSVYECPVAVFFNFDNEDAPENLEELISKMWNMANE